MRKFVVLSIMLLLLTGCSNFITPGGYTRVQNSNIIEHKFDKDSFKVLGPVTVQTSGIKIFLIFQWGDNGYASLFEQARNKYPDLDNIIDIKEDTDINSLLYPFWYEEERTLTGVAIRYNR